jgi:hypothetical protein
MSHPRPLAVADANTGPWRTGCGGIHLDRQFKAVADTDLIA